MLCHEAQRALSGWNILWTDLAISAVEGLDYLPLFYRYCKVRREDDQEDCERLLSYF